MYSLSLGYLSRFVFFWHPIKGKLIKMSAAVNSFPQRYLPPLGELSNCSSRKLKCVSKLGCKKMLSIRFPITRVIGLASKGTCGPLFMSKQIVSKTINAKAKLFALLTLDYQRKDSKWHETALRIMHIKSVTQPLLSLASDLILHTCCIPLRHKVWRKVPAKILNDCPRFSQHNGLRCGS